MKNRSIFEWFSSDEAIPEAEYMRALLVWAVLAVACLGSQSIFVVQARANHTTILQEIYVYVLFAVKLVLLLILLIALLYRIYVDKKRDSEWLILAVTALSTVATALEIAVRHTCFQKHERFNVVFDVLNMVVVVIFLLGAVAHYM
jgi:uncharacterized membrane protein YhaH (DUF805 family)